MTEEQFRVLSAAQDFVSDLFTSKIDKTIHFHTLQHTQEVVAGCETMADYYHLEDEDRYALMLAAWFHDTGYSGGKAMGHEQVSIELAIKFLNEHKVNQQVINKVVGCINATRLPQTPHTLIEQIIADADLFHLGTSDFKEKNKLVREELSHDHLVLAGDTIVVLGERIIGKPTDRDDAIRILSDLSGRQHKVITGVVMIRGNEEVAFSDTTAVDFHELTADQIAFYVDKYKPYDKAGAYAIQEWIGVVGIKSIDGDFYNVMGLPVSRVVKALESWS